MLALKRKSSKKRRRTGTIEMRHVWRLCELYEADAVHLCVLGVVEINVCQNRDETDDNRYIYLQIYISNARVLRYRNVPSVRVRIVSTAMQDCPQEVFEDSESKNKFKSVCAHSLLYVTLFVR